jgi:hypothetical protein
MVAGRALPEAFCRGFCGIVFFREVIMLSKKAMRQDQVRKKLLLVISSFLCIVMVKKPNGP